MGWRYMVQADTDFTDGMKHIDTTLRQKLLGMVV